MASRMSPFAQDRPRRRSRAGVLMLALGLNLVVAAPGSGLPATSNAASTIRTEVLVYGGTPGGILAAVTAARAGADVILLEPTQHLGGMMSSGLSWTDIGNKATLGGFAREFFDRVQTLEGSTAYRYAFQPHTAEAAFRRMIHSTDVDVRYGERLPDVTGVAMDGTRITALRTTTGHRYEAAVFIDATYEGDLLARAGVSHRLGRESIREYGETLAGVRESQLIVSDLGDAAVPFVVAPPGRVGSADDRIQAANYRMCFSSDPDNEVPFTPPDGYGDGDYAFVLAYLAELQDTLDLPPRLSWLVGLSPLANDKFDVNDQGQVSTAVPGLDWSYPELGAQGRADIAAAHRRNSQGLFWFLSTDPRVPASIRDELAQYGLCKDEFTDNGNWPWLLYLREGRRMVGAYVLTQRDITTDRSKPDIIGVASYRVDSHLVSRWLDARGRLLTEGSIALPYLTYAIPYRAITPQQTDVTNLLVPVAASASHVAQSSLRMEPHYLIMGEAAGEAAAMVLRRRAPPGSGVVPASTDVQLLDVTRLQRRLAARGVYLTNPGTTPAAR